jgi:magnesium and cobalt exporter, CNNM family
MSTLSWPVLFVLLFVCLAFSAFFSGAETGYMSVSRVRLRRSGLGKTKRGQQLQEHLKHIEDPILTCLVGTNMFNVMASALATMALTERFGSGGEWLAVILVSTLVIVFGEILPKVIYREFPEAMTLASVPGVRMAMAILTPVRHLLQIYTGVWHRLVPAGTSAGDEGLNRVNLAALLLSNSMPSAGDRRFAKALDRFLKVGGLTLGSIMHPLDKLVTVESATSVEKCLEVAALSGFSRIPIKAEDTGQLQGYVLVWDLIFINRDKHKSPVPRKMWKSFLLVDVRMSPYELFEELRHQSKQMAVVVDPGGSPLGLITLEDLIESVIGSVNDEFDNLS